MEPYVIAADIYAASHHVGDGGWTWYTGSAGWMQRAGLESVKDRLYISIPASPTAGQASR
ncbi:GH36-type glycosyl hydrolase domain-containing protein [Bradyrhizobium sp. sBnM-33]|uniref:GH36-type glycosyl hydrolase domain-containing protein n=1 Tax=Bradyrhizobium sp. sBnM-33 TaxID=2831780 RepID=UPI001BD19B28